MRKVSVSKEAKRQLTQEGKLKKKIVSWFPVDLPDCECQPILVEMRKNPTMMGYLTCPKDKTGYKQYEVKCKCGNDIAVLWAKDETLTEWCDLHYLCEHNKKTWKGCMAVNISPIDLTLGFECTCGNDTRDFSANTTLSPKDKENKIKENKKNKFSIKEIK